MAFMRLLFALLVLSTNKLGYSATISKINQTSKIVTINEGSDTGFIKKARVCFYDGATKIGCSFIRAAKNNIASLKPKEKLFLKLKEGLEARLEPLPTPGLATTTDPAIAGKESSFVSYIKGSSYFSVTNAVAYKNLSYTSPPTAESQWNDEGPVKTLGGGFEVGFAFTKSLLAIGAYNRMFIPKKTESYYNFVDDPKLFAISVGKAQSYGLYLDYYYLNFPFGIVSLNIGNGIGADQSVVTFTMEQGSDDNDLITDRYSAKSQLSAAFLRTNILLDFNFGSLGFHFGSTIAVPVTKKSRFQLDTFDDPQNTRDRVIVEGDLKTKLSHQAKFGAELLLGGYYAF